jgi:hypothetical protein
MLQHQHAAAAVAPRGVGVFELLPLGGLPFGEFERFGFNHRFLLLLRDIVRFHCLTPVTAEIVPLFSRLYVAYIGSFSSTFPPSTTGYP